MTGEPLTPETRSLIVRPVGETAIAELAIAHDYARDAKCDPWQFAVEISRLLDLGLTPSDLRWLVEKGLAMHARETTQPGDPVRYFTPGSNTAFSSDTRFLLTDAGLQFADLNRPAPTLLRFPTAPTVDAEAILKPHWDRDDSTLYFGRRIVKRFKRPSPNQALILATFQEENWPRRIDDPLPPAKEIDPRRRLHDTIKWLNRNVDCRLLYFSGDGTGEGVRWEPLNSGNLPLRTTGDSRLRAAA